MNPLIEDLKSSKYDLDSIRELELELAKVKPSLSESIKETISLLKSKQK